MTAHSALIAPIPEELLVLAESTAQKVKEKLPLSLLAGVEVNREVLKERIATSLIAAAERDGPLDLIAGLLGLWAAMEVVEVVGALPGVQGPILPPDAVYGLLEELREVAGLPRREIRRAVGQRLANAARRLVGGGLDPRQAWFAAFVGAMDLIDLIELLRSVTSSYGVPTGGLQ